MTTRSIFQKVCPSCMASVTLDLCQCSCGYQFDHDDTDADLSSEEIRLKAEQLYESYLTARAEQAASAAKAAQAAFAADPSDPDKSERVADTIGEAQTAAAALNAQHARIAEMKKTMQPAAAPQKSATAITSPKRRAAPRKSAAVESARFMRKTTTVAEISDTARANRIAKAKIVVQAVEKNPPATVAAPVLKKPEVAQPIQAAAPNPAFRQVQAAKAEKNPPATVAAPVLKKPEVAQPLQAAAPNPAFRQVQAAKAEKIVRTVRDIKSPLQRKNEFTPVLSIPKKASSPAITVPANTKAAPHLYKEEKKKDCPNCTSSVDINAANCRCGFEFPASGQLIPPLAMSDEDRAEFAKLFSHP
ncbi:MAG: hypothetical protein ACYC9L_05280 [Sulfuricaulis sp.]